MARTAVTRSATLLLVLVLALTVLGVTARPAAASAVRPSAETRMIRLINAERTARGLPALRANLQMIRLGREWARTMATQWRVYHRPNLADVVDGDFVRLADNVGFTRLEGASDRTLVNRLHKAFMQSSGHRRQILGRYNQVGVGLYRTSGGAMFVAVNFISGARNAFPLYRDSVDSPHRVAIARLFRRGAVHGCSRNRFCPRADGSRSFLAATIDRAANIRIAQNYVAATCATSYTCRTSDISRGEMAVILAKALRLEPVPGTRFSDVGANRGLVNAVVKAGIMSGCSTDRFCPGRDVSRGRVARTVYRAIAR